tara:strand:+ start:2494 stop:3054 length:561 start_codon:yes stop_codon:yes gene_type:complete
MSVCQNNDIEHVFNNDLTICGCIYLKNSRKTINTVAYTAIIAHMFGFFVGLLPFIVVNITNDIPGFLGFIIIPTLIILLLGIISSVLLIPGLNICEISCRLCAVSTLGIISAVFHSIFALVEALIFWTQGLYNDVDWVAGLLLLKNVVCVVSEVSVVSVSFATQDAIRKHRVYLSTVVVKKSRLRT